MVSKTESVRKNEDNGRKKPSKEMNSQLAARMVLPVNQSPTRSEDEMQETRRKMDRLQEELHDLRQHVSASPAEVSSEDLAADRQELIQECEAFQIVTRDQAVLRLFKNLKKAAATQVPILLLGETGTGKEVFAKGAHALSPRRQGPFI